MSPWITGAILALGAAAVGEAIWINGRMRRFLTYAEQLLAVGADNVAKQPGKSAPRTAADDVDTGPIALPPNPPLVQHTPAPDDEWRASFNFKEPSQ